MLLGVASDKSGTRSVFNPMVDYVIKMANCPVILAQGELPDLNNPHGTKILVPTGGSESALKATELSFLFLQNTKSELHFLKVVEENEDTNEIVKRRQLFFGKQILNELKDYSKAHGVNPITQLQVGPDPETVILETIVRKEIDLLILGTRVRPAGDRLYLGPRIERLLNEASCPVIILNT
jgi:nucleotide-binding universal stress UspA family protein